MKLARHFSLGFFLLFSSVLFSHDVELSVGGLSSCASPAEDKLYCWGSGVYGQIPLGQPISELSTPQNIPLNPGEKIIRLSQSNNSNSFCAIFDHWKVKCWGTNATGQLGLGTTAQNIGNGFNQELGQLPYVDLGSDFAAQEVVMGASHTCALAAGGKVKCWGYNVYGQLGLGDTKTRGTAKADMGSALPYVDLGPDSVALQLCAGETHTCAVLKTGDVKCWGGAYGHGGGTTTQIGVSPAHMGANLKPVNLAGEKIKKVACGNRHTCVLSEKGKVKCFGSDNNGILGHEKNTGAIIGDQAAEMGSALPETKLSSDLEVVDLSCGPYHCCALIENSSVKCWGYNSYGNLGLGDVKSRGLTPGDMGDNLSFVDLGNLAEVEKIQAGGNNTCATLANGDVKCWGYNYTGQLGIGTKGNLVGSMPAHMGTNLKPLVFK